MTKWCGQWTILAIAAVVPVLAAAQPAQDAQEAEPIESLESIESRLTGIDAILEQIDQYRRDLDSFYRLLEEERTVQVLRMTVDDCVTTALAQNLDIEIAAYAPAARDADVMAALGQFDPVLTSNVNYSRSLQQASSETVAFGGITAVEAYRTTSSAGVQGQLPWGTQYNASYALNKEETTFNQFRREWSGGLTLTVTQPLLRGFGKAANLARLQSARNAKMMAEEQLRATAMNTVAEVLRAYWDLVGAIEQMRVREESVANAQRLVQQNQARLDLGAAAAMEVSQAQSGVAARLSDLFAAQQQVMDAELRLKTLLNMQSGDLLAPIQIVPIERPEISDIPIDENRSVALALEHRPEISQGELEIDSAELETKRAANDLLPQVDVRVSDYRGARGPGSEVVWDGTRERQDYSYSIGVTGSFPIGNRAARGTHLAARINEKDAELRLARTKNDIAQSVRTAINGVRTNRVLVENNRLTRRIQEMNVAAEEKKLELGVVTSFQVLQVQEELTLAQVQEVQAAISYVQSYVNLQLAEGTLLDHLGIDLDPANDIEPVGFFKSAIPPILP